MQWHELKGRLTYAALVEAVGGTVLNASSGFTLLIPSAAAHSVHLRSVEGSMAAAGISFTRVRRRNFDGAEYRIPVVNNGTERRADWDFPDTLT